MSTGAEGGSTVRRRRLRHAFSVVAVVVAAVSLSAWAATAQAQVVLRGIDDPNTLGAGASDPATMVREISDKLNARVIRLDIPWMRAEHERGVYNDSYLSKFETTIDAAVAHGLSVIVTVYQTPPWASDRTLWTRPPQGYAAGRFHSFYPPSPASIDRFRAFAEHLSRRLAGRVLGYECWCEPNSWAYLYPQRTGNDPAFGAHRYQKMLAAFSQGVHAGDPGAKVIAGATAPMGRNDRYSTSPQRFATLLRNGGAARFFDVYSHHPYMTGGTKHPAPEASPPSPSRCVSLGNIGQLLSLFPAKPFYLTEYGYNTRYTYDFGLSVTSAQQASYLRRAYSWATRFPQVKLLVWYLTRDWSPSGRASDPRGIYTGLRTLAGKKKRAWFAFAGGNSLTLSTPTRVRAGSALLLRGRLTCASVGGVAGKRLVVKRYRSSTGWRTITKVVTGKGGYYHLWRWPTRSGTYRVSWPGVVQSPRRTVTVY
jgi:hypothetical protein